MSDADRLRVAVIAEGLVWGGIETHLQHLLGWAGWGDRAIQPSAWVLSPGALEETLRGSAAQVACAPRSGRLAALSWLHHELARVRPHVIHAHGLVPEILGALLSESQGRGPLLVTVHSDPGPAPWSAPGRSRLASSALYAARRLRARGIIAVSSDIRERLGSLGLDAARVALVYNGVPRADAAEREATAEVRRSLRLAPDAVLAGMIGRLEAVKGHARVLRVLSTLRDRVPLLRLVLAGDGPLRGDLTDEVRRLGLEERVRILGFRRDAPVVMSLLGVGLFASDHEGVPFAALEMMARGVPLVCFAVGGLREIVRHGHTGFLVPPYDEAMFAERVAELAANPEQRMAFGRAAIRTVEDRYSIAAMAEGTVNVWRTVARCRSEPQSAVAGQGKSCG
jgi:glycosyltransferase involved in cell wall biosynthesis